MVGHRGGHVHPAGALRPRPARGARPRQRRPHGAGPRPRPRPRRPRRRPAGRRPRATTTSSGRRRCAPPRVTSASSTRRRPRSASSATTPPRCAPTSWPTTCCACALAGERASALVLGHTRWASIGIISQPNAHPVDSLEVDGERGPYVTAALNGDVDNFADLKAADGLRLAAEITTDAKVIPTLVSHRLAEGADLTTAFRDTVASFEGSVAIGASAALAPRPPAARPARQRAGALRRPRRRLLRGRLRALRAGGAHLRATCASTATPRPTPRTPTPAAARSSCSTAPAPARSTGIDAPGLRRHRCSRSPTPTSRRRRSPPATSTAARTPTSSSRRSPRRPPASARRCAASSSTRDGALHVALGRRRARPSVRERLRNGRIDRIQVIGQGTAHVAGQSLAGALLALHPRRSPPGRGPPGHRAVRLRAAAGHERHAHRRHQPVGHHHRHQPHRRPRARPRRHRARHREPARLRPHRQERRRALHVRRSRRGDERGVHQGLLRADRRRVPARLVDRRGGRRHGRPGRSWPPCATCPPPWRPRSAGGPTSRSAAQQLAPGKRYWAIVGNGTNRIAAEELRIKLSELCYRSIACDATEDKKHIDLSCEPLILVCAAGLEGSTADDVAKEVAIYRAHKASPIVIATDGQARFAAALHVISVPETHPQLAFVLTAVAGHLFGYEAALAIDAQARPMREARAAIEDAVGEHAVTDGEGLLRSLRPALTASSSRVLRRAPQRLLRRQPRGQHRGAAGVVVPLRPRHRAARRLPGRARPDRHARRGGRRPHRRAHPGHRGAHPAGRRDQAPGQDRHGRHLPQRRDAAAAAARAGRARRRAPRATASATRRCAPSPTSTRRSPRSPGGSATRSTAIPRRARCRRRSSTAAASPCDIPSRTERSGVLRGTKHTVAVERQVFVTRGRDDGRTLVIVPETKDDRATGAHAPARPLPRPPRRCRPPAARCRATATAGRRSATRCSRPSRPSARTSSPRCLPPTSSSSPSASWPTAGGDVRPR